MTAGLDVGRHEDAAVGGERQQLVDLQQTPQVAVDVVKQLAGNQEVAASLPQL